MFAAERRDGKLAAIESKQLYRSARENGAWYRAGSRRTCSASACRLTGGPATASATSRSAVSPTTSLSGGRRRSEDVHLAANLSRQRYGREPGPGEPRARRSAPAGPERRPAIDINNAWRAQGEEHGLTKEHVEGLFNDQRVENQPAVDLHKELLAEVTRERSMINTHELKAKAYELSAGVCRPADADKSSRSCSGPVSCSSSRTARGQRGGCGIGGADRRDRQRRATEIAAPVSKQAFKQARREIGKQIKARSPPSNGKHYRRSPDPGSLCSSDRPAPARAS